MLRGPAKRILQREHIAEYAQMVKQEADLLRKSRQTIVDHIAKLTNRPKISIVMPVYNAPEKFLRIAIESVRNQIYDDWELCIADDASTQPHVEQIIREYAERDSRIKAVFRDDNGHISAASNSALNIASGDYVALLDQDDELAEQALYWIAVEICANRDVELLYSDEDKIDQNGRRFHPYHKPDWNPELLLGQNYISHLGVYRRQRLLDIGGFRLGLEGSQDWDLVLRFTEGLPARAIRHIPAVLYHWRIIPGSTAGDSAAKPYALNAGRRAVAEHLQRGRIRAELRDICNGQFFVPVFAVEGLPKVSIIIPTRNGVDLLKACMRSLGRTDYPNIEIVVLDNQSDDPGTIAYLEELAQRPDVRILAYPHPFDYAKMHNFAVPQAQGDYVCLLNNDIEVIAPGWLRDMLGVAQRGGVGAVGAKLLYPDGTVQHAGVVLGLGGIAAHPHKGIDAAACGYFGRAMLMQSFSAVTAACMVLRKSTWMDVGGMDENLPVAYNDVDLCLRLQERGLRNVWVPSALLYHHESKTRGSDLTHSSAKKARFTREHAYMQWRWGPLLRADPAYNPNLTLHKEDFSLTGVPRSGMPWLKKRTMVDVPYGIPGDNPVRIEMAPGSALSGSFPIPRGLKGRLSGIGIMIGNYHGRSDGRLTLRLAVGDQDACFAESVIVGSRDNDFLELPLIHGGPPAQGYERMDFRLQLLDAHFPLVLWAAAVGPEWDHRMAKHEGLALRIALHMEGDDA
uniref:Glycosyltransferase family 2 protein n=3 Tax=Acidithiobacillus sulfuriphilus TaxID=1867749 RepID=A0A3M8QSU6_9PROT|nr:glycosyltransferase family 2 protein [Acidithiobacillus sulfuriphilus]